MALRRKKSKKSQAMDLLETYVKFQAAKKAAKGAGKAAKGTAVYKAQKRTPALRAIPVAVAGVAVATVVAVKKLRGSDGDTSPAAA